MQHYYHGKREAELVIRTAPESVDFWLRKARGDRRRWRVRLFRPGLRQFLDGFIAALVAYPAQPNQRTQAAAAPAKAAAPHHAHAAVVKHAAPAPAPPEAVAVREVPPTAETPPTPTPPVVEPRPAPAPVPATPPAPHLDVARPANFIDGDYAIGVFRLSGWSTRETAPSREASGPAPPPRQALAPVVGPAPRAPEIVWTNSQEEARAMGVVDLSAYDMFEQLGDLRDLFDRHDSLRRAGRDSTDP